MACAAVIDRRNVICDDVLGVGAGVVLVDGEEGARIDGCGIAGRNRWEVPVKIREDTGVDRGGLCVSHPPRQPR